jgi:type IV pilus assembly protein PilP
VSRALAFGLLGCLALGGAGCGEEEQVLSGEEAAAAASPSAQTAAPKAGGAEQTAADGGVAPIAEFTEADFAESEESRDPFRNYTYLFERRREQTTDGNQRRVKAAAFGLDELKLVGIISGGARSAMFNDSTGFGWVLYTGDYVGRPELVSTGGTDSQEVPINWRVDRISPTDVVFIREDPAHPEIAPTTRVQPLYPAGVERGGS